jgi:hypothetical protein
VADRKRVLTIAGVALLASGGIMALSNASAKAPPSSSPPGTVPPITRPPATAACFVGYNEDRKLQIIFTNSWDQIAALYTPACRDWLYAWYAPYRTAARGTFFPNWSDAQLLNLVNSWSWTAIAAVYGWPAMSWLFNWYAPRRG